MRRQRGFSGWWRSAAFGCLALAGVLTVPAALADPNEIETGRRIALGLADAPACASCHGRQGEGNPAAGAPRLAAQSGFYLRKQLDDYAAGTRPGDVMSKIARALSEGQRAAVSAYYAAIREAPYPPPPRGDALLLQRGAALSAAGAPDRGIRSCRECHASEGTGIPPSYPYLAGQFAGYTERQLEAWREGHRRNDPLDVMARIAERLSDDDIRALGLYFARLRPSPDEINDLTPPEILP
ncbi:MAG TPA: c-type cytochrome [Alphaproteobacteria bacterium]|nr:c-type cytochrome [Alphaproteobacteria bacterium]